MITHQSALLNLTRKMNSDKGKLEANVKRAKRALITAEAELACLTKSVNSNEMDHEALNLLIDEKLQLLQTLSPSKMARK